MRILLFLRAMKIPKLGNRRCQFPTDAALTWAFCWCRELALPAPEIKSAREIKSFLKIAAGPEYQRDRVSEYQLLGLGAENPKTEPVEPVVRMIVEAGGAAQSAIVIVPGAAAKGKIFFTLR